MIIRWLMAGLLSLGLVMPLTADGQETAEAGLRSLRPGPGGA